MKTLKQYIMLTNGIADPSDIHELWDGFVYGDGVEVWEGDYDERRWYTNSTVVMKFVIDGVERFFEYTECNPKGDDSSREDCGWEKPDLDDLPEVFPKEITTTIYVSKEEL